MDDALRVNWCELIVTDPQGQVRYHNAWITDWPLSDQNVAAVVASGRARWKIEQHGEVVVTDRGEPAYLLKALPQPPGKTRASPPDYYARLLRRQPKPLSAEATRRFWEDER